MNAQKHCFEAFIAEYSLRGRWRVLGYWGSVGTWTQHRTKRGHVAAGQTCLDLAVRGSWEGHEPHCVGTDTLGVHMDSTVLLRQRLDGCLAAFLSFICDQRFSTSGNFFLPGTSGNVQRYFLVNTIWGDVVGGWRSVATAVWWVEARDIAIHPTILRTVPTSPPKQIIIQFKMSVATTPMTNLHLWLYYCSGFEQQRTNMEASLGKWEDLFHRHISNILVGTPSLVRGLQREGASAENEGCGAR